MHPTSQPQTTGLLGVVSGIATSQMGPFTGLKFNEFTLNPRKPHTYKLPSMVITGWGAVFASGSNE